MLQQRSIFSLTSVLSILALGGAACDSRPAAPSAPTAAAEPAKAAGKVEMMEAPPRVDVAEWVKTTSTTLAAQGRIAIVYEGATWCEPCQRFHAAAAAGKLDSAFPNLTLLEFDADRDIEGLLMAGYASAMIPLFALPGQDGRATGKYIEGGIKGDNAADELIPRLQGLIAKK